MIVVTGTKRSGTSMWMQILKAAGLPVLGEAYMGPWEQSIKDANPRGFYESKLRNGIFYATNPDPKTGRFIPPKESRRHVVKIFIPGLIRSDLAFLDRVLATVRDWRSYSRSILRLYEMEDQWLAEAGADPETGESRLERAKKHRPRVHPAVEWWFDNYELIRDVATRRYSFHVTTYEGVLAEPEPVIRKVLGWVGAGDVDAALGAVEPDLRTQQPDADEDLAAEAGLDEETVAIFDAYYRSVREEGRLSASLIEQMNALQAQMETRFGKPSKERKVR